MVEKVSFSSSLGGANEERREFSNAQIEYFYQSYFPKDYCIPYNQVNAFAAAEARIQNQRQTLAEIHQNNYVKFKKLPKMNQTL
jgi:hypothetical protein